MLHVLRFPESAEKPLIWYEVLIPDYRLQFACGAQFFLFRSCNSRLTNSKSQFEPSPDDFNSYRQQTALPRPYNAPPNAGRWLRFAVLHLSEISESPPLLCSVTKPQTATKREAWEHLVYVGKHNLISHQVQIGR